MAKSTKGAGHKPAPLTSQQKQFRRRAALDEIAHVAGWSSWSEYATAVKRGVVVIVCKPPRLYTDTADADRENTKENHGR